MAFEKLLLARDHQSVGDRYAMLSRGPGRSKQFGPLRKGISHESARGSSGFVSFRRPKMKPDLKVQRNFLGFPLCIGKGGRLE